MNPLSKLASHNRFSLTLTGYGVAPLSILSVKGSEALDIPWRYDITFTCSDKNIDGSDILSLPAFLMFMPPPSLRKAVQISSLEKLSEPRILYGVVTEFSQLSVNKEEAHYRVLLSPRLALLDNQHACAMYQNQSVVSVVESVLRSHGFTGVDYRLELKETIPYT